jgi:hypothetical protein
MSLLDTASLIVTPNGYKEGKLYSVIPSDGSGDLSVTRATTATRVNSQGLVELVPYNLLEQSNSFSTSPWSMNVTSGQAGKDGQNNAWLLTKVTATTSDFYNSNVYNGDQTFTIYVKKESGKGFKLFPIGTTTTSTEVNLQTGVVLNQLAGITSTTVEAYSSTWWKISVALNMINSNYYIYVTDGAGTQIASSITIQDAQVNIGLTAKAYFPTTDRLNIPRLDYSNGSCPSLLVEPQRTNLLTWSSEFSNWLDAGGSVTTNTAIAPDGTMTADTLTGLRYQTPIGVNVWTFSCYAKANGGSGNFWLRVDIPATNGTSFDLTNGTYSAPSGYTASIEDVGNGWYRCTMTTPSVNIVNAVVVSSDYGTNQTLIWGAQFEAGSYPTSYIPTTSPAVTRNADGISKTGISSLIGQTEGTVFCEIKLQNVNSASTYVGITSGTFANGILIGKEAGVTPNKLVFYIFASGSTILNNTSIALSSSFVKCAIAYKSGNWAAYANGSLVASGTSTFTFNSSVNRFGFGSNAAFTALDDEIEVKATALWPTRLTNAQLAQLTTI